MKLFELFAELSLDTGKFNKGVSSATRQGSSMANTLSAGMQRISAKTIALGNAMYDMGKQAARAVANFAKDAVGAYAEAEQLLGGVETLFKGSANIVIENARNAYMSAGMDANQYMQTVMNFSASLLQGLGGDTKKAAQYADMAVQDMSDNANKFGTDMASIQNAYQGFAKQNYTMLDNLKLGYGGTKTEMQRLLKDAEAVQRAQGKNVKYSIDNLSDVYEAIHVIQTEMDITGTTAKEASKTIGGSFNAFKAAWSNLIIGLGTGEDTKTLVDNLVNTGKTFMQNLFALAPQLGDQALSAVDDVLRRFDLYRTLSNAYKVGKWKGLAEAAIATFKSGVVGFGEWAIEKGSEFLGGLWEGLSEDTESAEKIKTFFNEIFGAAGLVLTGLKDTAVTALKWVKENGPAVAAAIGPMTVAFAALELAASPLSLALAGIIAFTTDWTQFEEKAPNVVAFFESLSGIEFDDFVTGITTLKSTLMEIGNYLDNNPEIVSGLSTLAAGIAFASGHPAVAAGLLGIGVSSAETAANQQAEQEAAMDAWAQSRGYTRDEQAYFLFPSWKTGEPDYSQAVYEEYHRWRIQNAIDQLRNATPSETPATLTGPNGQEIPMMPSSNAGEELGAQIGALATAIGALPAAVQAAATSSITSVTVEMDGATVGRLVSDYIARDYRQSLATST